MRVRATSDTAPARASVGGRSLRSLRSTSSSDISVTQGWLLFRSWVVPWLCWKELLSFLRCVQMAKRSMDAKSFAAGLKSPDDLADASIMATLTPARRVAYQAFFECRRNNLRIRDYLRGQRLRSFL